MRPRWWKPVRRWRCDEVPIGAVVSVGGEIVAAAFNQPISTVDPTAHAEILALRAAAQTIGNYRLTGATLCVTVEPCAMCVGAMVHARIGALVYGASEPKTGAVRSTLKLIDDPSWNHRMTVVAGADGGGVSAADAGVLHRKTKEETGTDW